MTRRQALRIGGIALGASVLVVGGLAAWDTVLDRTQPFRNVRGRWLDQLTGAAVDDVDALAGRLLGVLTPDQTWSDLALSGGERTIGLRLSYERLRSIARAYATPGSRYEHDEEVRDVLLTALDHLHETRYNEHTRRSGNWWDREIGIPLQLTATSMLLYDDLGADRLERYMAAVKAHTPAPAYAAANRVWTARVVAERALLLDDEESLTSALRGITPAFRLVTSGDGIRPDGSFLQHDVHPYSGGYGLSLLTSAASVLALLRDTPWQLSGTPVDNLLTWVDEGLAPWLHAGAVMGPVRGRNIARVSAQDHDAGRAAASALRLLSRATDGDRARRWRGLAAYASGAQAGGAGVEPLAPPVGTTVFPAMDRVVHRRPAFTVAVAMSSARIASYESIGAENRRGWYSGSGAYYLYDAAGSQYDDHYWPTVDAARIAGTTVAAGTPAASAGAGFRSDKHWVGGVAVGSSAAVGMAFRHPDDQGMPGATGQKSWFLLDDEVVALGAGIASSSGRPVETVVDNRRLLDPEGQQLVVDGRQVPPTGGTPAVTADGPGWAHLSGATPGTGIGYVFRTGQRLSLLRERRTGRWSEINRSAVHRDRTVRTNSFATLWLEHGVDPVDARYGYVLLPGATPEGTAAYAAAPRTEVLANGPLVQAVRRDGTTALNVWATGAPETGGVSCDRPAAILLTQDGTQLTVAVADPTQQLEHGLRVTVARPAKRLVRADGRVTVERLQPGISLLVDVGGTRGGSVTATFEV
ncbi:polysaccharide lyase 8 family protein [Promicromonospora iranensis]|uniref:Hyaluronate lyase n=1 Tax=Promicromonospora iranensis TaxID=1105144 RepID=A0ABU2CR66_9MICO|nr:polysaccharide lyase 8 family protein [Promicromonospora iranensis]MDR7383823.1 hyaluronate lyase [Promicromonospora iranensis]